MDEHKTDEHKLEGRHAVREALAAGHAPDRIYLLRGGEGLNDIYRMASKVGAVIVECDRSRLDAMSLTRAHQGVIALLPAYSYAEPEDIFALARDRGEEPLIVVCDGVEDEGNLGAIIRSAEAFGAHGVVIPKRRSARLSPIVSKAAAGAAEHILVVRVPGIPSYLRELKERREMAVWVYGTSPDAPGSIYETDFSKGGIALVVGNESDGLSHLSAQSCDALVNIPLYGKVASLNVSAATAVSLSCIARQRVKNA